MLLLQPTGLWSLLDDDDNQCVFSAHLVATLRLCRGSLELLLWELWQSSPWIRGVLGVGEDGDGDDGGDGGECASLALFDNFDPISKYCRFSGMKKALGLTAESKVLLVRSNIYKQLKYFTIFFDISIFDHFFQYLYVLRTTGQQCFMFFCDF